MRSCDLAVDAVKRVAADGHFFGEAHTLARYEAALYRPLLSDGSKFENRTDAGSRNVTDRAIGVWKKALADYVPPPLVARTARAHHARGRRRPGGRWRQRSRCKEAYIRRELRGATRNQRVPVRILRADIVVFNSKAGPAS